MDANEALNLAQSANKKEEKLRKNAAIDSLLDHIKREASSGVTVGKTIYCTPLGVYELRVLKDLGFTVYVEEVAPSAEEIQWSINVGITNPYALEYKYTISWDKAKPKWLRNILKYTGLSFVTEAVSNTYQEFADSYKEHTKNGR